MIIMRKNKKDKGKNGDTVRIYSGLTNYDEEQMASWLEDMAAEGLVFAGEGFLFTKFKREEPIPGRRYYISPGRISADSEEADIIASSGWIPADQGNANTYFYTDDPEALEIFTDKSSYRKSIIRSMIPVILLLCYFVYLVWFNFGDMITTGTVSGLSQQGLVCSMHDFGLFLMVGSTGFFLWFIYKFVWAILRILRLIGRIREGNIEHRKVPYKTAMRVDRAMGVIGVVSSVLVLVAGILMAIHAFPYNGKIYNGTKPVDIAAISPKEYYRTKEKSDALDAPGFVYAETIYSKRSLIMSEDVTLKCHIAKGTTTYEEPFISRYLVAGNEKLAKLYLAGLLEVQKDHDDEYYYKVRLEKPDLESVDDAIYMNIDDGLWQYLYLRKDNVIEIVEWSRFDYPEEEDEDWAEETEYDLRDHVDAVIENMEQILRKQE